MQSAIGHVRAVVNRILFIGVSVQIVLGLFWMLLAFDDRQAFAGSAYTEWLDGHFSGFPYEPAVYLIQLSVALFAGYRLMEGLGAEKAFWKIWGSLALMTYPYAMQCHMAILPDSLAFSFFLLLCAAGLKGKKSIYVFWLLSAVFLPEYLYFGAVPVVFGFVMSAGKNGDFKKIGLEVLVIGVVAVMVSGFHKFAETEYDSLGEAWFRRTVWSSFYQFYPDWPEELRQAIGTEEYDAIQAMPENMITIVQPKAKAVLGEAEARDWFKEFGMFVFKANREQLAAEVIKDAGGYAVPQVMVPLRLAGKGGYSLCGRNYEVMRAGHPLLTRYYVDYSAIWFVSGVMLLVVLAVADWFGRGLGTDVKQDKKSRQWILSAGMISGGLMVIWYTLWESNLWDPKKALFVGALWILSMIVRKEFTGTRQNS